MRNAITKLFDWYFSKGALPYWCIIALDCTTVFLAGLMSYFLLYMSADVLNFLAPVTLGLLIVIGFHVVFFVIFRTYRSVVRYSSFVDLLRIGKALLCAAACTEVTGIVIRHHESTAGYVFMPGIHAIVVMLVFSMLMMWLTRLLVRSTFDAMSGRNLSRAFIFGVREGGVSLARSIRSDSSRTMELAGFVDNEDQMSGHLLMGVRVYDCNLSLPEHMKKQHADLLLVSPLQSDSFREQAELIDALIEAGIRIMMMPPMEQWDGKSPLRREQLREIDIEDLLPRNAIQIDMDRIGEQLRGRRVLITGAAGSIGSEIARQVARCEPNSLVLIDQAETPMHDMRREMARNYGYLPDVKTIVCSICLPERMEQIFEQYRPEYVFHAAAYKHVPMMEDNPHMAIYNNVYGTRIVADLAVKYGVQKFVMVSTDKAVNPTNIMGCSKRICEIYCQSLARKLAAETQGTPQTQFITTRFGNVLGSNGSFVPIFKEQIKTGGPVTVTHPDIVRYFMLIPEACQLVLTAGMMGKGGEIYAFDMGQPVRIADVARRMIRLSGAHNIEIAYTGLRDGEKLYEEVLAEAEHTHPTEHPQILVANVREYPYEQALHDVQQLYEASLLPDDMKVVRLMKQVVPEFLSQHSKYAALDATQQAAQ